MSRDPRATALDLVDAAAHSTAADLANGAIPADASDVAATSAVALAAVYIGDQLARLAGPEPTEVEQRFSSRLAVMAGELDSLATKWETQAVRDDKAADTFTEMDRPLAHDKARIQATMGRAYAAKLREVISRGGLG